VPSPADDGKETPWWWDHLAEQAAALRLVGFTAVWLPPVLKGASGKFSVGYDVFDDYDLGSKSQKGTVPTRYGTREQLSRCVAVLRACGLDVYLDVVDNQRAGGNDFRYRYADARGGDAGRFPKDRLNFHPNVPQDPGVFGSPRPESSFGDDLAIINGRPKDYVSSGLIEAGAWLTRALDVQGYRIDDAKGISTEFVPRLLNSPGLAGKFAVGEFFDGNADLVRRWLSDTRHRASAFDFPLRFALARMCNQPGSFDMGASLDRGGLAGVEPLSAVTFAENHDTDSSPSLQPIVTNKMLAYSYILMAEGYPCVFYRDYSTDPGCYGLKPHIDNLIWIHERLAAGPTVQRWKDAGVFCFERSGGPHLLTALNKDTSQRRTITVDTGFGANTKLHDYTGHARDVFTNQFGQATLEIPANVDGLGYVAYSRDGQGFGFALNSRSVTQEIEVSSDLDIGVPKVDVPSPIGRVWCAAKKPIELRVTRLGASGFLTGSGLEVSLEGPDGTKLVTRRVSPGDQGVIAATTQMRGWHSIALQVVGGRSSEQAGTCTVAVKYVAPVEFLAADQIRG
jgi:alpha-amylase